MWALDNFITIVKFPFSIFATFRRLEFLWHASTVGRYYPLTNYYPLIHNKWNCFWPKWLRCVWHSVKRVSNRVSCRKRVWHGYGIWIKVLVLQKDNNAILESQRNGLKNKGMMYVWKEFRARYKGEVEWFFSFKRSRCGKMTWIHSNNVYVHDNNISFLILTHCYFRCLRTECSNGVGQNSEPIRNSQLFTMNMIRHVLEDAEAVCLSV